MRPPFGKRSSSSTTPTNSQPSQPIPPIFGLRQQRFRAPAVALSTLPPPYDPIDPAPNEPGSSKESAWRAVLGAVKMAVSITRDSSDIFPPLKAVMVALSVLMDNCDVGPPQRLVLSIPDRFLQRMFANAEQIKELEGMIESLRGVLTSPVSVQDHEERARRELLRGFVLTPFKKRGHIIIVFRRKLTGIVAKLGPLAEQHDLMKFFKNVDHASILNGLVKELANAIAVYQVRVPNSIAGDP